jgi:hypothetical protein
MGGHCGHLGILCCVHYFSFGCMRATSRICLDAIVNKSQMHGDAGWTFQGERYIWSHLRLIHSGHPLVFDLSVGVSSETESGSDVYFPHRFTVSLIVGENNRYEANIGLALLSACGFSAGGLAVRFQWRIEDGTWSLLYIFG